MNKIYVVVALLSSNSASIAAEEYYVARDVTTKKCMVMESPPTSSNLVLVENGAVYFSQEDAERVRVSSGECTSEKANAAPTPSADAKPTRTRSNVAATGNRTTRTAKKPPNVPPVVNERQANSAIVAQRDPFSSFLSLFR